ncbi:unnamed protein product [Chrysoparadoxa australica]
MFPEEPGSHYSRPGTGLIVELLTMDRVIAAADKVKAEIAIAEVMG